MYPDPAQVEVSGPEEKSVQHALGEGGEMSTDVEFPRRGLGLISGDAPQVRLRGGAGGRLRAHVPDHDGDENSTERAASEPFGNREQQAYPGDESKFADSRPVLRRA